MAKFDRKRFCLASVIDRLHVENAVFSKKPGRNSCEQAGFQNFINPTLLQSRRPKEELITIIPDEPDKVRRHVYTRSRSKQNDGALVCELCGHRSFKMYGKTVEVTEEDGKLIQAHKKICRKCFIPNGSSYKSREKGEDDKKKVRPYYEPPQLGSTCGRASKSWHFIRRDFVTKKENKLHKRKCNESEFSKYLTDASDESSGCDDDDDDDDEDDDDDDDDDDEEEEEDSSDGVNSTKKVKVPLQELHSYNRKSLSSDEHTIPQIHRQGHSYINNLRNHKGYKDHLVLINQCNDLDINGMVELNTSEEILKEDDPHNISPRMYIKKPDELGKLGDLLHRGNTPSTNVNLSLAVNQSEDCSTFSLPIDVELSPKESTITYNTNPNRYLCSADNVLDTHVLSKVSVTPEDEYVEVECTDSDDIEYKLLEDIDANLEIKQFQSEQNYVTQLLTPCIEGSSSDDDLYFCFEDKLPRFRLLKSVSRKKMQEGVESHHRGLCRLVTILNRKKSHYRDVSFNSCFYNSKGVYCKKKDLPSFVQLDDKKSRHMKHSFKARKKEIDDFILKNNPLPSRGAVKSAVAPLSNSYVNLTLRELKQKFWPRSVSASGLESGKDKVPGVAASMVCGVCCQILVRSYSSYNRNNAPAKLLPLFDVMKMKKIRVCRSCLPSLYPAIAPAPLTGMKRHASTKTQDAHVASKIQRLDQDRVVTTQTAYQGADKLQSPQKYRRFSRFVDTPIEVVTPKINQMRNRLYNHNLHQPTVLVDTIPSGSTITLNDELGRILINNTQNPQNPLGASNLGKLNLKVVQNPNEHQIKSISQNSRTKYVIVQTAPNSGESRVQKLSTDIKSGVAIGGETKLGSHGDITINGQKYKIDTEFKLNDLVKDNENALLSAEAQKDILSRLPSILKRTVGSKAGVPTTFKIVNMMEGSPTSTNLTSSISSKALLSPTHMQKFVLQSIAPCSSKEGSYVKMATLLSSAADSSNITTKKVQPIAPAPPRIISNVNPLSTFSEFGTSPVKKVQPIAPAPPKVIPCVKTCASYVADLQTIDGRSVASISITSVSPHNTVSVTGTKPHTVVLPATKSPLVDLKSQELKQPARNLVEIRLPENIVHGPGRENTAHKSRENTVLGPARKIILNSPVESVNYKPAQTTYLFSNLAPAANEAELKSAVDTTGMPLIVKTPIVTSKKAVATKPPDLSSNTVIASLKPTVAMNLGKYPSDSNNLLIVNSSNTSYPSLVRSTVNTTSNNVTDTAMPLLQAISSVKIPFTIAASSTSLVKSINELRRVSLSTYSNTSPPSLVRSLNNGTKPVLLSSNAAGSLTNPVNNASVLSSLKNSMSVNHSAASLSLVKSVNDLRAAIAIKNNTPPLSKPCDTINTSITTDTLAKSPGSVKTVNYVKIAMIENANTNTSITTDTLAKSPGLLKSVNYMKAAMNTNANTNTSISTDGLAKSPGLVKSVNYVKAAMNSNANTNTSISTDGLAKSPGLVKTVNYMNAAINTNSNKNTLISTDSLAKSPGLVKSVSYMKGSMTTNANTRSLVTSVSDTSSTLVSNTLLSSISRQIQQQIKSSNIISSKPHIVKISPRSIPPFLCGKSSPGKLTLQNSPGKLTLQNSPGKVTLQNVSPGKVSLQTQLRDSYKVNKSANNTQVLELNNGIKIVGTYLNTDIVKSQIANAGQANAGQVNVVHVNAGQVNSGLLNAGLVNAGQLNAGQVNTGQVNTGQVNNGQVNAKQVNSGQVNAKQVNSDGVASSVCNNTNNSLNTSCVTTCSEGKHGEAHTWT